MLVFTWKIVNQFTFQCCIVRWIRINRHALETFHMPITKRPATSKVSLTFQILSLSLSFSLNLSQYFHLTVRQCA